jgi:hypothetical protein
MSRGWESKSVENQQDLQDAARQDAGTAGKAPVAAVRGNIAADAELKRKRQALELQRERILSERTASPHRRTALGAALLEIEEKLGELGWVLHL